MRNTQHRRLQNPDSEAKRDGHGEHKPERTAYKHKTRGKQDEGTLTTDQGSKELQARNEQEQIG